MTTYDLYSVGHGNKGINDFIADLKKLKLQVVVDIRTTPYSSNFPDYNQEKLMEKLKENNIEYIFFGDKLGGRPQEGFSNFVKTRDFKKHIAQLLYLITNKTAVLMCSEFDYTVCHRRFINDELRKMGIGIKNINKNGSIVKEEQPTMRRYQK